MLDYEFLYLFLLPIYIIYLIRLIFKKVWIYKIIINSLFYFYIVSLLAITIFPIPIQWVKEIWIYWWQNNNFIIFSSILEIVKNKNLSDFIKIKQIIWNIVLFLPLWFFIPFIWKNYISIKKSIYIWILASLSIELFQFIISIFLWFNYKSADIDDILLNTLWFIIWLILFKLFNNSFLKK